MTLSKKYGYEYYIDNSQEFEIEPRAKGRDSQMDMIENFLKNAVEKVFACLNN